MPGIPTGYSALPNPFSDPQVQMVLSSMAEQAATSAAKKTMNEGFFLLGVDLNSQEDVDSFRTAMRKMRSSDKSATARKSGIITSIFHVAASVLAAICTSLIAVAAHSGANPPAH